MPLGTILHYFVSGVKPLWEDPACKEGARITLRLPKTHTAKYWEDLLFAMLGEHKIQWRLDRSVDAPF